MASSSSNSLRCILSGANRVCIGVTMHWMKVVTYNLAIHSRVEIIYLCAKD